MTRQLLQDKQSIMHVLISLMKDPSIFTNRDYPIDVDDFPEPFHKVIFGAINNLHIQGAEKITVAEIDGVLSKYSKPYQIFNSNQGVDYLTTAEELASVENFEVHYKRLKKYSFLRECDLNGIDITEILDVNTLDTKENTKQQRKFDEMDLDEMVVKIEAKMIHLRDKFMFNNDNASGHMGDNAEAILHDMLNGTAYGAPMGSKFYTAATLGAKRGKLHMVSAPSGVGKTRWNLMNAIRLSVPVLYDLEQGIWYKNKTTGDGVLYIGTELMEEEVVEPILCAIAQVDETKAKEGELTKDEIERLQIAVKILENSPFYFEQMLDFDLADIEHSISKHVNKYDVAYIVHDYVHTSSKLMASFNKINKNLQEHQLLLQVMTRLKELAQKFDVFILTSTQLNSNYKEEGGLDETSIAGAKSMVNKVDIGAIMIEFSPTDEKILENIKQTHNLPHEPNVTINIYKSRGTKWKLIRIWTHFERGLLHMHDAFVTDYKGRLIDELKPVDILFEEQEDVEDLSFLPTEVTQQLGVAPSVVDEHQELVEKEYEAMEEDIVEDVEELEDLSGLDNSFEF